MFKNKFKRGPKADHRVQPEAVTLFSAVVKPCPQKVWTDLGAEVFDDFMHVKSLPSQSCASFALDITAAKR